MDKSAPFGIGDVVHGFAYGAFGRDHFECTRVDVRGPDWAVFRGSDGGVEFLELDGRTIELLQKARDEPCDYGGGCKYASWGG